MTIGKNKMTADKALVKLETLCAGAERCSYELRQKLYKWQINQSDAEKIMASLENRGFVNDERFTKSFIHDKTTFDRWGPRKIAVALAQKRIDSRLIRELLAEVDENVIKENLIHILKVKLKDSLEYLNNFDFRAKLYRFLIARGYSSKDISDAINNLRNSLNEE